MPAKRTYMVYYAVAILIWGTESVLTKAFLLDSLAPQAMLVLRTAITALVLLPLVLLDRPKLGGLSRRDWGAVLVLGVFGTALPMMLYFAALDRIPASTTMLLYRTEPIFVILLSVVVLHQRVALRVWVLTLLAVACSYLIAVGRLEPPPFQSDAAQGALLVVAATALYAVATLVGKALLDKVPPLTLVWLRFSLALPVLFLFFGREAMAAIPTLSSQDVLWLVWMGSVSSGLTFVFYYKGMQASNAILASVMTLLGPVTGITLSILVLDEHFTALQVVGIVGLLVIVYFLSSASIQPVERSETDSRRRWASAAGEPGEPAPSSER